MAESVPSAEGWFSVLDLCAAALVGRESWCSLQSDSVCICC